MQLDDAKGESKIPFSMEAVEMMFASAPTADWKMAIMLAAYTGKRLADVLKLKWEVVDFVKVTLTWVDKKTKRKRPDPEVKPLHDRLAQYLESIAGDVGGALCPSLVAKGSGGKSGLSQTFIKIMEAAGINREGSKTTDTQKRKVSRKSFHGFRHFINTELEWAGVDQGLRIRASDQRGHEADCGTRARGPRACASPSRGLDSDGPSEIACQFA